MARIWGRGFEINQAIAWGNEATQRLTLKAIFIGNETFVSNQTYKLTLSLQGNNQYGYQVFVSATLNIASEQFNKTVTYMNLETFYENWKVSNINRKKINLSMIMAKVLA